MWHFFFIIALTLVELFFLQIRCKLHSDSKSEISKNNACPERHLKWTVNVLVFLLICQTFIALKHPDEIHQTFHKRQSVLLAIGGGGYWIGLPQNYNVCCEYSVKKKTSTEYSQNAIETLFFWFNWRVGKNMYPKQHSKW